MYPSASLQGLNLEANESDTTPGPTLTTTLNALLPLRTQAADYGNWKLAAVVMVALPVALWLIVALLN
jgi:hypothetical protein